MRLRSALHKSHQKLVRQNRFATARLLSLLGLLVLLGVSKAYAQSWNLVYPFSSDGYRNGFFMKQVPLAASTSFTVADMNNKGHVGIVTGTSQGSRRAAFYDGQNVASIHPTSLPSQWESLVLDINELDQALILAQCFSDCGTSFTKYFTWSSTAGFRELVTFSTGVGQIRKGSVLAESLYPGVIDNQGVIHGGYQWSDCDKFGVCTYAAGLYNMSPGGVPQQFYSLVEGVGATTGNITVWGVSNHENTTQTNSIPTWLFSGIGRSQALYRGQLIDLPFSGGALNDSDCIVTPDGRIYDLHAETFIVPHATEQDKKIRGIVDPITVIAIDNYSATYIGRSPSGPVVGNLGANQSAAKIAGATGIQKVGTETRAGEAFSALVSKINDNGQMAASWNGSVYRAANVNGKVERQPLGTNFGLFVLQKTCRDVNHDGDDDNDRDGLCDNWETSGIDIDGDGTVDLTLGASSLAQRDIFVEYDFMAGHPLGPDALEWVKASFRNAPISASLPYPLALHFENGGDTLVHPGCQIVSPDDFANWQAFRVNHFGTPQQRADSTQWKKLAAMKLVYRYMITAHSIHDHEGNSGWAQGSDFVVSVPAMRDPNCTQPDQKNNGNLVSHAGTIMHELGHTLSLGHGGARLPGATPEESRQAEINCKPNYLSLMNYLYQFDWPTLGPLDYSPVSKDLDTNALNEAAGLAQGPPRLVYVRESPFPVSNSKRLMGHNYRIFPYLVIASSVGAIDWDLDGTIGTPSRFISVNDFPSFQCVGVSDGVLRGSNDWEGLQLAVLGDFFPGAGASTLVEAPTLQEQDPTPWMAISPDSDGDGVVDLFDNCPTVLNADQVDANGNGIGDLCELTGAPRLVMTHSITEPLQGDQASVGLLITNSGNSVARNVRVGAVSLRLLSGTGGISLISPVPILAGPIPAGSSALIRLNVTMPATVKSFIASVNGTLETGTGRSASFSAAAVATK